MTWYLIICAILTALYFIWNISGCKDKRKGVLLFALCFTFWVFAACRADSVGADTRNYIALSEQLKGMSIKALLTTPIYNFSKHYVIDWEFGFRLIVYLFETVFFFLPPRSILGFMSALSLLFLFSAIRQQTPYCFLSTWLYMTLGFYQTSLNMAQHAIALGIVLWGIKFIYKQRKWSWVLCVLLAGMIHYSVLVFLPFYWVSKLRVTRKRLALVLILIAIINSFSSIFIQVLRRFIPLRYLGYAYANQVNRNQILNWVFHISLIIVVLSFYLLSNNTRGKGISAIKTLKVSPYSIFFIAESLAYALTVSYPSLTRGATVFSLPIILFLPDLISRIPVVKYKKYCLMIAYLLSFAGYIVRLLVNNIGLTQPDSFFT